MTSRPPPEPPHEPSPEPEVYPRSIIEYSPRTGRFSRLFSPWLAADANRPPRTPKRRRPIWNRLIRASLTAPTKRSTRSHEPLFPSDAALEGFRLTRERPIAVLIWAAVRLVYGIASLLLLVGISGPAVQQLAAMENSAAAPTPAEVMPLTAQLAPAGFAILILSLIFYSVVYTAVLRAILRPADQAFAYLRLSVEELRQFGLAAIIFALCFVYANLLGIASIVLIQAANGLGQGALRCRS